MWTGDLKLMKLLPFLYWKRGRQRMTFHQPRTQMVHELKSVILIKAW